MKIKEILPEHVGREVKLCGWSDFRRIIAVDNDLCWIENMGIWEIVEIIQGELKDLPEPKKKPSELVNQKMVGKLIETNDPLTFRAQGSAEWANARIDALLKVLDEEAEIQETEKKE